MTKNIKSILAIFLFAGALLSACKKEEYSYGELVAPTDVTLTTVITGATTAAPTGNGTGEVIITSTASNVITYKVDYGDGITEIVPSGTIKHKYSEPGTKDYTITVNAVGTGGLTSTTSKKIRVFVDFQIPANVISSLTGGASKVWITDKNVVGHFGVGDADKFFSNRYSADPNTREAYAYDDEITFEKDASNNIYMTVNNKGASFSLAASTSSYGFSGGDGSYPINTGGKKKLGFANATSASTPAISTRIQFTVPGNGIINFGTGGVTYEIIALTDTQITLRNIGSDGLSWYQKLTVKP
ncbi:PKD domain-containing protein [Pedobacter alpinus]|uniref:PKD domain-containing protein n=1 Tax=Pedobacter alpinus TaxID=1590643 RepID=A0ABW5TUU0_9SPHI